MNMKNRQGWTPLDPIQTEDTGENYAKALEIASLYRQTFETEAGEGVLDMLIKGFLMRPIVRPDSTQFEAGIREGKADLIRQILAQIEFAKNQ